MSPVAYGQHHTSLRAHQLEPTFDPELYPLGLRPSTHEGGSGRPSRAATQRFENFSYR